MIARHQQNQSATEIPVSAPALSDSSVQASLTLIADTAAIVTVSIFDRRMGSVAAILRTRTPVFLYQMAGSRQSIRGGASSRPVAGTRGKTGLMS
jgi:hypothetical protein